MNRTLITLIIAAGVISTPVSVLAESGGDELSLDGLELVEKDRRGALYADPEVDWSVYDSVLLDKATVSFRKNWQRDQNRWQSFKVNASDMEKIKQDLSELFNEVFAQELSEKGDFKISTESGESVMRISPHIVDLDVYAPDTPSPGIQVAYTDSAGRMTLKLEIYDSVTGDLLATASDRREAPRRGYMQWTTSVSNRAEARQMLQRWAKDLRKRLDEARATGNL